MNDDKLATSGSFNTAAANRCWRAAIEAKETLSGASEIPMMTPVSCTGKKPLGTMMYSQIVATSVPIVTSRVTVWCRSTNCTVRP